MVSFQLLPNVKIRRENLYLRSNMEARASNSVGRIKIKLLYIQWTFSVWKPLKTCYLKRFPLHIQANVDSTWSAQDIKYKASQHERQDRTIITQCSFSQFFSSSSNSIHLISDQGNLLQEGCNLRLLICQLHLVVSTREQKRLSSAPFFPIHMLKYSNSFYWSITLQQFLAPNSFHSEHTSQNHHRIA